MAPELTPSMPPPTEVKREVALGMTNLGSTCYMNAVLQALAHAPELCMAMDCEPHHVTCPIAKENAEKKRRSPKPSPDATEKKVSGGTRKSRRSGKKSPPASSDGEDGEESKFCALCEVEQHLARVHEPPASAAPIAKESDAIAPHAFVTGFIDNVAPNFRLGRQEDSHEFLRILIEAMQKSCARARKQAKKDSENTASEIKKEENADTTEIKKEENHDTDKTQDEEKDLESEYPFKLFRGTVKSNVTCDSCHASSSKIDPIEDIGLEVTSLSAEKVPRGFTPPSGPPVLADVQQAFQRFARAEPLDSGYKCDRCGKVGRATKESRLASIPPILTLHLKRFRYGPGDNGGKGGNGGSLPPRRAGRSELSQLLGSSGGDYFGGTSGSAKIEGHIKFEQVLNIRPFLTPELQSQKSILCRLFAVVVHAGKNSHSGHYIAYVKSVSKKGANEWWKMDDARVTRVSWNDVQSAECYMLFYRCIEHPVAVELRNLFAKKEEAAAAAAKAAQDQASIVDKVEASSDKNAGQPTKQTVNKRKREPPEFVDPEDWARVHTRFPPSYLASIRRAQEYISENLEFKQEYFNLISDETDKSLKVGSGPSGVSVDDDVVGGTKKYRKVVRELLFELARKAKDKGEGVIVAQDSKAESTSSTGVAIGMAMRGKEKPHIVPVVDADDNFL